MPGAIAMAAVFFVTIVEMIFARGNMCGGNHMGPAVDVERGAGKKRRKNKKTRDIDSMTEEAESCSESAIGGVEQPGFGMAGNRRTRSHSMSQGLRALAEQHAQNYGENTNSSIAPAARGDSGFRQAPIDAPGTFNEELKQEVTIEGHEDGPVILTPEQIHKKALLQCVLLEMGILFHSVFIGMALSVTGGPGFLVLLLAIVFHRMSSPELPLIFSLISY